MVILLLVFFFFKPSSILPSSVKPQLKLNGAELSLIVSMIHTTHPDPPRPTPTQPDPPEKVP